MSEQHIKKQHCLVKFKLTAFALLIFY